jgi:hypothetical protein
MSKYSGLALAAVLIGIGLLPTPATAQNLELPARSFTALAERGELEPGKNLLVTFKLHGAGGYQQMKLKLVRLTSSAIFVEVEKPFSPSSTDLNLDVRDESDSMLPFKSNTWAVLEIPEHRVSRLAGIDSLGNGALIGAVVGASPVVLGILQGGGCGDPVCLVGLGIMTGAGAGIGVAVDYARVREGTVYYEGVVPAAPTLTWSPVPLVSKDRKGLLFVLTW